ncbi:hypothetical protein HZS_4024 [Henneguya salminicola]|nr:hypothetical protein HZS_4024 [Henneguya salminicola]
MSKSTLHKFGSSVNKNKLNTSSPTNSPTPPITSMNFIINTAKTYTENPAPCQIIKMDLKNENSNIVDHNSVYCCSSFLKENLPEFDVLLQ